MSSGETSTPPEPNPTAETADRLVRALDALAAGLAELEDAASAYRAEYRAALPPTTDALPTYREQVVLEREQLAEAARIIRDRLPVAALTPRGLRWRVPQIPDYILLQARIAGPEDRDYFTTLDANSLRHDDDKKAVPIGPRCGRANNCKSARVYIGSGVTAPSCYRHLDDVEGKAVHKVYDATVRTTVCLGCRAEPGHSCVTNDSRQLVPVNGEWPTLRQFRGISVHTVRLDTFSRS